MMQQKFIPYMVIGDTNPYNTGIGIVAEVKISTLSGKTRGTTTVTMATKTVSRNLSSKIQKKANKTTNVTASKAMIDSTWIK